MRKSRALMIFLRYLWRSIVVVVLTPPSLIGLWSVWTLLTSTDAEKKAEQDEFIQQSETICEKLPTREEYGNCMDSAYRSLAGGEVFLVVFAVFGIFSLIILSLFMRSWLRKRSRYVCDHCGSVMNKKNKGHIQHKDGDRKNNSAANLSLICEQCYAAEHKEG